MPSRRERLRQKPDNRRWWRGPSTASELHGLLVVLEDKLFEELLTHPAWRPEACRGESGVAHVLDEFHLLIQKAILQEVTELRICLGRTQGTQIQRARFRFSSRTTARPGHPEFRPAHRSSRSGRGRGRCAGFTSSRDAGAFALLLGQLSEEVAHALQSHIIEVEAEAQREVCIKTCSLGPGWFGSVDRASACGPKVPGFYSCQGCRLLPGQSLGQGVCRRQPIDASLSPRCFCLSLSLPLSLKINGKISSDEDLKKQQQLAAWEDIPRQECILRTIALDTGQHCLEEQTSETPNKGVMQSSQTLRVQKCQEYLR